MTAVKEIRLAPNIYKTPFGWRVYVRRSGKKAAVRFPPGTEVEELILFRDRHAFDQKKLRQERGRTRTPPAAPKGFAQNVDAYLELATVKAMAGLPHGAAILFWKTAFGNRHRSSIEAREITEHLHALKGQGYSGSTVNKFRTALMSLWTELDGRSAANPVKDTATFEEAALEIKGQPYPLLRRILHAMPLNAARR